MSSHTTSHPPRRNLLKRGLALLAAGAAVPIVAPAPAAEAAGAIPGSADGHRSIFKLYGRSWHVYGDAHEFGAAPAPGDRLMTNGELTAQPGGAAFGEFHAASFHTASPMTGGPYATGSFQLHTFTLADGAITGMGMATGEEAIFAIVGGTGRFAGVTGSYTARQRPATAGGDGSAEFAFTFTNPPTPAV